MQINIQINPGQGLEEAWVHTFLSPWCQRACTPPSQPLDVFANTNALPTPHCGDLYGGFIMRPDQSTQLPAPLPSLLEDKAWSFKSQASHQGFFFLVSCPHPGANQEPTQSCFNIKKKTLLSLKKFQMVLEPCVRNGGQRPSIRKTDAPSALITQEITRGGDQYTYFLLFTGGFHFGYHNFCVNVHFHFLFVCIEE